MLFVYHSNAHRSYIESISDVFAANMNVGIGLSKYPCAASVDETAILEHKPKKAYSSENSVNQNKERNTTNMNARDIINRLNRDIVLDSKARACGKWIRTSNDTTRIAYNVSIPPHRGPKARRVIMRLKPVAGSPSNLEVAFYTREDDRCQVEFRKLCDEKKMKEKWFREGPGESGVKSIIQLATVGESEWQDVVAGEMDRLFDTYKQVVEAEP